MKTLRIYLLIFSALVGISLFSSCHKKAKEDPRSEEPVPTGTVMCHLHSFIEDNEIDRYNTSYTTHEGRNVLVGLAQLYISDIELVKLDGSVYSVPNSKILKKLDTDTYFIGEAPVGNYKSMRFKVGLSPASNLVDFSNTTDSTMWFSKTKADEGYVFLNFKGAIDTSDALTGTLVPFEYKIGSNANYKQVNMPEKGFTVVPGEVQYQHIIADFNKLFNGISIKDNANLFMRTTADNTSSLAQKLVNNIPSLFIYE